MHASLYFSKSSDEKIVSNFFPGIHELAHSAGFGVNMPNANRALGIFANLPIGIPFSVAFKGYHLEHHKVNFDRKKSYVMVLILS